MQHLEEKIEIGNDSEYCFHDAIIEVKLTRSKAKDVRRRLEITNNVQMLTEFRMTEVQIRENYPWDFERTHR